MFAGAGLDPPAVSPLPFTKTRENGKKDSFSILSGFALNEMPPVANMLCARWGDKDDGKTIPMV